MEQPAHNPLAVRIAILPIEMEEEILNDLTTHIELSEVDWIIDEPRFATVLFVKMDSVDTLLALRPLDDVDNMSEEDMRARINNVLGSEAKIAERIQFSGNENAVDVLMNHLTRKVLTLPIKRCVTEFNMNLKQREKDTESLLRATPKTMPSMFYGESQDESEHLHAKIQLHHPKTIEKFGNKKLLDSRAKNRLSRVRTNYAPLATIAEMGDSTYSDSIFSLDEHISRAQKAADGLTEYGISPDPTNMSYTQLNVGLPFFGGLVRSSLNLTDPGTNLDEDFRKVSEIHIRGLGMTLNDLGHDEFVKMSTRASVPVYSYQGPATNTTLHTTNQVMWASMMASTDGIFSYENLTIPNGIGFRLQGSKGKIRDSFIVFEDGKVGRSHVYDGVHKFPDVDGLPATEGIVGARVRHVDNPNHCQNHALLPYPSYISDTKSYEYKLALNVSFGTLMTIVPGSVHFVSMWKDAWENLPWVKRKAADRGITEFSNLMLEMKKLGEFPFVGDIGNFDGSTPWPIAKVGLEHTMSERAFNLTEKIWFQPTVGCYVGVNNEVCYYTIDKRDKATAELTDMLGSGIAVTSPVGRQVVPGVLGNAFRLTFDISLDEYYELPTQAGVSMFSLTQRNAGDDHAIAMITAWLWSGIHPKECRDLFHAKLEELNYYKIDPEDPPLIAGNLAHLGEDGRLLNWSLSPGRLYGNNVYPENTKNAIGIDGSLNVYLNSAEGTDFEKPMEAVASAIRTEVYNFESMDELSEAKEEDETAMLEGIGEFSPEELIAMELGIPAGDLYYKYSLDELIEMGADEDMLSTWKKPVPESLTINPFRFFNQTTVERLANDFAEHNKTLNNIDTGFSVTDLPASREPGVNYESI